MKSQLVASVMAACGLAAACVSDAQPTDDAGTDAANDASIVDATKNDVAVNDAAQDAPTDAVTDGGDAAVVTTYNDITVLTNWETFQTNAQTTFGAQGYGGFGGKVFDSKNKAMYFLPVANGNGVVFRYDTTQTFTAKASWSVFDATTVDASGAVGYSNGIFDGRYIYALPWSDHRAMRYDTTASFTDGASWTTYDYGTLYNSYVGSSGFDGRYLYTSPYTTTATVVRYDTQGGFGTAGSWSSFGLGAVSASSIYLAEQTFDGRYIYMVRGDNTTITRYDTQAAFGQAGSWLTYDVANVTNTAKKYRGAIFDGKFVTFVPYGSSVALQYDTTKAFTTASSWDAIDLTTVNAAATSFIGGTFDGRYVYMAPYTGKLLMRFDTTQTFSSTSSWTAFDLTQVTEVYSTGNNYPGISFDGSYIYLAPTNVGGLTHVNIVRFFAKTPPSLPAQTPAFE